MMYHITITGFDSGLNEVLNGHIYDYRTKRIANPVKKKNDKLCIDFLRFSKLQRIKLEMPLVIHYKFYCKDKRRDRMNVASAFDKSFQDALQKVQFIPNDGWSEIKGVTFDFDIDKKNPRVEVVIEEVKGEPVFWSEWKEHNL